MLYYICLSLILALSPLLLVAIYRLYFHALARIPGPRLAAVSSIWYAYQVRNGRLLHLAQTLHKVYGPAVRVRPNEIWFSSAEAYKVIYSSNHGLEKSDFYLATAFARPTVNWRSPYEMSFPDTLDLLSERDISRYRLQRKLIGPVYQRSNMRKFEATIHPVMDATVAELSQMDGAEVDLKEWMHIVALETLGAIVLSWSPGYLKKRSDGGFGTNAYLEWRKKSVMGLFPIVLLASFSCKWLGKLFRTVWALDYVPTTHFKPFFSAVRSRLSARIRSAAHDQAAPTRNAKKKAKSAPHDLLTDLLELHATKPEFTDLYLRRMAVTNFGAGHETLCSTLTACIALIASHRELFQAVASEIRSTSPSGDPVDMHDMLDSMPLTCASIKEAQRLHPALGMSLSRAVAASDGMAGTTTGSPLYIHGYRLPAGTVVGCCPAALHRNSFIFGADVDTFRPQRWLECDKAQAQAMNRFNLIWGGGMHTCPGRYLAELIVCKAVIGLIRAFDIEVAMPSEDHIKSYFMAILSNVTATFKPAKLAKH